MRENKNKTLNQKINKISSAAQSEIVFRAYINHASKQEREDLIEKFMKAMILEIQELKKSNQQTFNRMIELETENDKLKLKLRNPKSKIRNKK